MRIVNAALAGGIVFLWTFWAQRRLDALASKTVAFACVPVWCWISMGALNAAYRGLPVNSAVYAGPWVLGVLCAALLYDLILQPLRPNLRSKT